MIEVKKKKIMATISKDLLTNVFYVAESSIAALKFVANKMKLDLLFETSDGEPRTKIILIGGVVLILTGTMYRNFFFFFYSFIE